MASDPVKCPRCGGEFQAGRLFAPSRGVGGGVRRINPAEWYPGDLVVGPWGGRLPEGGRPITAHRCRGCGYLEFYAR